MSDQPSSFSAAILAERVGGRLVGPGDLQASGVNSLDDAKAEEITFIADARHAARWGESQAGVAVVTEGLEPAGHDPQRRALIFVPDAELATAVLLELFLPPPVLPEEGVHPQAWVHEGATLGPGVRIGPHVTVERGCVLGAGVVLHAGVRLYADVTIGDRSVLHANVVIRERCRVGRQVILHQNVSIGADGFGYRPSPDGTGLVKMPHIGTAILEDEVEIGANTCVDRGKFGATVIGAGTKIDNLVQIAHNCRIGRGCVVAGLAGLAGSVEVGDGVAIGAQAGVLDHVRIGHGASVGGGSSVIEDIPDGQAWLGYPAAPGRDALRQWATIRKLPALYQRVSSHLKEADEHASSTDSNAD